MLYAWVGDQKRAPSAKGERTTCRDCGGLLTAVIPVENTPHWRHKAGDCDPWSESEPRRPPKVPHLWPPKLLHPAGGDLMH